MNFAGDNEMNRLRLERSLFFGDFNNEHTFAVTPG